MLRRPRRGRIGHDYRPRHADERRVAIREAVERFGRGPRPPRSGLLLELARRHGPPPGPMPLQADEADATLLRPEAVEFGRLDLPAPAHLGGPESQRGHDDEECRPGAAVPDPGLLGADRPAPRPVLRFHPVERMFPGTGRPDPRPPAACQANPCHALKPSRIITILPWLIGRYAECPSGASRPAPARREPDRIRRRPASAMSFFKTRPTTTRNPLALGAWLNVVGHHTLLTTFVPGRRSTGQDGSSILICL